jgi:glycosyltransferase involved in cell wall biosynthesis
MRVLVVAPQPFFTPRGTPLSVYHRTAAAARLGAQIDLITYGQGADVDVPGVRLIRIPRFGMKREVPAGPSLRKLALDPFLALWTIALLLRRRYRVVHAHEEAVFFCLALKPIFRFKLIYDMHSQLPEQLANFRFPTARLFAGLFRWLEERVLRHADAVITICPDLAEYAAPRARGRHFLIENSLFDAVRLAGAHAGGSADLARVRGALDALPPGAPLIVYAGTLEAYQGIDLLLRAFARVRGALPAARLLVLGGSPEQLERYRALAGELGLADACALLGRVSQEAARLAVAAARVQVSPRIAGNNTPLKLYEQLASGVALVATDVHAHTQVLGREVAFLAPAEPEAFAKELERALGDAPEREKRAAAAQALHARRYARAEYDAKLAALLASVR